MYPLNSYNSPFGIGCPLSSLAYMKKSFLSRWFYRKSDKSRSGRLTPDDIRRKLATYEKQEGPAVFGGAQLYRVEEVEQIENGGEEKSIDKAGV